MKRLWSTVLSMAMTVIFLLTSMTAYAADIYTKTVYSNSDNTLSNYRTEVFLDDSGLIRVDIYFIDADINDNDTKYIGRVRLFKKEFKYAGYMDPANGSLEVIDRKDAYDPNETVLSVIYHQSKANTTDDDLGRNCIGSIYLKAQSTEMDYNPVITVFGNKVTVPLSDQIEMKPDMYRLPVKGKIAAFQKLDSDTSVIREAFIIDMSIGIRVEANGEIAYRLYSNANFDYLNDSDFELLLMTAPTEINFTAPVWLGYDRDNPIADDDTYWNNELTIEDLNVKEEYLSTISANLMSSWNTKKDLPAHESFTLTDGEVLGTWIIPPSSAIKQDEDGKFYLDVEYSEVEYLSGALTVNVNNVVNLVKHLGNDWSDGPAEIHYVGDVNADGDFNVEDIQLLQDWLLGRDVTLVDPYAANAVNDGELNVFDLCMIKQLYLQKLDGIEIKDPFIPIEVIDPSEDDLMRPFPGENVGSAEPGTEPTEETTEETTEPITPSQPKPEPTEPSTEPIEIPTEETTEETTTEEEIEVTTEFIINDRGPTSNNSEENS